MGILRTALISTLFMGSLSWAQVNINTATIPELTALKGIGEKKAAGIIKYRKANGKFKTVDELAAVAGVGEKTIKRLGKDVSVSGRTNLDKISAKNKMQPKKKKSTGTSSKKGKKKTTK